MTTRTPLVVVTGQTQQMPAGDTVPLAAGGTGATTAGAALTALGAVPSARTLTVAAPLTGGGDLSDNRPLGLSYDTTLQVSGVSLGVSALVALASHTHAPTAIGAEPAMGNPGTSGYVLSSTTGGVRSWVAPGTFSGVLGASQGGTGTNNGTYTLTVPATGTAALLGTAQTFTAAQTITAGLNVGSATGATAGQVKLGSTSPAWNLSGLVLAGNEAYQPVNTTDATAGIGFQIWVNRTGNKQLLIRDTAAASSATGGGSLRIGVGGASSPWLGGASSDNSTTLPISFEGGINVTSGLNVGSATGATAGQIKASGNIAAPTATFTPNTSGASTGLTVINGDITTYRTGGTTGVIYLNSAGNRYLYFDGEKYQMPGAELDIYGSRALHEGNYSSYALPLTGGTVSGPVGIRETASSGAGLILRGTGTTSGTFGLVVRDNAGANTFLVRDDGVVWVRNSPVLYSDARLKTAIGSIPSALATLLAIPARQWRWKTEPDGPTRYGPIAQEVEACMPELVVEGAPGFGETLIPGERPLLSLRGDSLLGLVHGAIHELAARVAALEAQ